MFGGVGNPDPRPGDRKTGRIDNHAGIPGMICLPRFLSMEQQGETLRHVDAGPWRNDLKRRVQHYGWRYDYRERNVGLDMHIGPLPEWLADIARRLHDETGLFDRIPDQAIVNEYLPGQGIARHIDRQCFGPAVATISLGDAWSMELRPPRDSRLAPRRILLENGSALIVTGEARTRWLHGIAARKREKADDGESRPRKRRVSLTFRTVLAEADRVTNDAPARPGREPPFPTDRRLPRG